MGKLAEKELSGDVVHNCRMLLSIKAPEVIRLTLRDLGYPLPRSGVLVNTLKSRPSTGNVGVPKILSGRADTKIASPVVERIPIHVINCLTRFGSCEYPVHPEDDLLSVDPLLSHRDPVGPLLILE